MTLVDPKTLFGLLTKPAPTLQDQEKQLITEWILGFQFFQPFRDEPEAAKLISVLEPIKLQTGQTIAYQDGLELCYIVSGSLYLDSECQTSDTIKKKSKKDAMVPKDWVIRPQGGKACYLSVKDPHTQIIVISGKKNRKFINKKLTSKWRDLARIIHRQPLFKYLDKDTLLDIAQSAKINTHYYNSIIYSKGEEALYSYILLQGNIKILSGITQVSYLSPEQIFGDEEILGGKSHRDFRAICVSEKVKVLKIQKSEIEKSLAVLTVLGKERSVEKYVSCKNQYRNAISVNIKRYFQASKEKQYKFPQTTKESLPLYKYKKESIDDYSLNMNDDSEMKLLSTRFMETLRSNRRRNSIRSKDVSHSPSDELLLTQRRSIEPGTKERKVEYFKLPHLSKS